MFVSGLPKALRLQIVMMIDSISLLFQLICDDFHQTDNLIDETYHVSLAEMIYYPANVILGKVKMTKILQYRWQAESTFYLDEIPDD